MKLKAKPIPSHPMEPANKNPSHGNSGDPKDLFESLPDDFLDEFLFSVLQLLPPDLKFLTQSLLVSHRFAATILRLPAVKIPLPLNTTYQSSPDLALRSNLIESGYASATNTLNRFTNLRSLHLLFPEDDPFTATAGYAYIKIKVEPDFYTVVFLQSNLKHKLNGNPDSVTMAAGTGKLKNWSGMYFWHDYLIKLVRDYPMVENFKISSPNSLTEICVGGEELVRLKMLTMEGGMEFMEQRSLRKLTLPEAGYVLKDVCFSARQVGRPGRMPENRSNIMGWDCGEDDEVFAEAMKLDLMSYMDEFLTQEMIEFNMQQQINWQMNQMGQQLNWPPNNEMGQQIQWHQIGQEVNWQLLLNEMGQVNLMPLQPEDDHEQA